MTFQKQSNILEDQQKDNLDKRLLFIKLQHQNLISRFYKKAVFFKTWLKLRMYYQVKKLKKIRLNHEDNHSRI